MSESPEEARKKIYESLEMLKPVYENSPTSINLKIFFNAKADELVNIFSDSPREEKTKIIDLLNAIDPVNTNKYQKILDSKQKPPNQILYQLPNVKINIYTGFRPYKKGEFQL